MIIKWIIIMRMEMQGIYLVASGSKYTLEACNAIKQIKEVMPKVAIALCTDQLSVADIDYIIPLEQPLYNFADKVCNFTKTPFSKTIFLDTDVFVLKDLSALFTLLDRFDIAAPHAPIEEDELVDLPNSFAEPNSGVIAYKKKEAVWKMFQTYERHYLNSLNYYKRCWGQKPRYSTLKSSYIL